MNRPSICADKNESILGDPTPFPPGTYFTICTYTAYPYSRGHLVSPSLRLLWIDGIV